VIVYSLKCPKDHVFEEWFSSSGAYEREVAAGTVKCPNCGSTHIEKAPMAPSVGSSKKGGDCGFAGADSHAGAPPCMGACSGGCFPE